MSQDEGSFPEAFKALGDPIRWAIVQQIAEHPELAGSVLEESLPVSRPTISYHIRILAQADLISVSKRGRNHYYSLRHDVLSDLRNALEGLMPGLAVVEDADDAPATEAPFAPTATLPTVRPVADQGGSDLSPSALPTW